MGGNVPAPARGLPFVASGLVADGQSVTGPVVGSYAYSNSASIAGTVLTTTGSQNAGSLGGTFAVGQTLYRNGVSLGVTIISLGTGTGGAGTYNLSAAPGDVSGVAITASSPTFTITNGAFTAADVGKGIRLEGWGANYNDLVTTIAAVNSPTSITLAAPPVSIPWIGRGGNFFQGVTYGTDNSVAVKLAHDLAYAAGRRFVQIPFGSYWVGNLLYAGNVFFLGEGASFLGNPYFRVFSPNQRSPYPIRSNIDPVLHMATFKATANPRIAFVGDSITTAQFIGNSAIYLPLEIRKELLRRYPNKGFSSFNFGIGGCAMSDLASASEINFSGRGLSQPYWHTAGKSWMYDITNYAWGANAPPHIVFIGLGTNVVTNLGAELAALYSVISQLRALPTNPDIILMTPAVGSSQSPTWYGAGLQKEGIGAFWRGFCLRNGLGFLDVGRHARMMRDGIDVLNNDTPIVPLTNFGGSRNLPITLPVCREYLFYFNAPASNVVNNMITTGNSLNFTIGDTITPAYQTVFQVSATSGGNFAVSLYQVGYGTVFGPIDTGVKIPTTGTVYFEFSVRENYVRFAANSTNYGAAGVMPTIWEGHVERVGGRFIPTVSLQNFVSTNIFPTQLDISVEQKVMPCLIDAEYTADIHPFTTAQSQLYRAVLDGERLYG